MLRCFVCFVVTFVGVLMIGFRIGVVALLFGCLVFDLICLLCLLFGLLILLRLATLLALVLFSVWCGFTLGIQFLWLVVVLLLR